MHSNTFGAALLSTLVSYVAANPAELEKKEPQISLPPLIPLIPGVTEPLTDLIPPLPILQFPTPPLPSEPFEVENIKPKKIGYVWTGAGDNKHKDFLATISLDDVS
jgi:selenium-binding protein 1